MNARALAVVAWLVLGCEQRQAAPTATPSPVDAGYDCEREKAALLADLKQEWPCSAPSQCQLLLVDGLICHTPVPAGMKETFRLRGQAWRSRCKPKHFDCFNDGQAACVAGRCSWEPSPRSSY